MLHQKKKTIRHRGVADLRKFFLSLKKAEQLQTADVSALLQSSQETKRKQIGRREFISSTAKAGLAIGMGSFFGNCSSPKKETQPVIVVVGAGIAGLYATYLLENAGLTAQLYEGSPRAGGRIMSVKDVMGEGLWTEYGGEFVDSSHEDILALCQRFDLPLLDRGVQSEMEMKEFAYFFGGKHRTEEEVLRELQPFAQQISTDIEALSETISFEKFSEADRRLDQLSIIDYCDALGIKGWFRDFINISYTGEYGMEAGEQSAINFLSLFTPGDGSSYELFGPSDERYSIIGGSQMLTDVLAARVREQLHFEHLLKAISQKENKYQLTFQVGASSMLDVEADVVILTLPFSTLREVDLRIPLPEWKSNAIQQLGYGTNSKLFVGVNERTWRKQGYTGYGFTDNGMMSGYDHTQMQGGNEGLGGYTIYLGGKTGVEIGTPSLEDLQQPYVTILDEVYPGVKAAFNGRFQRWHWPSYVYSKCSYTSYKTGQYTTICGAPEKPVENLYFAGEHCSFEFQGFMNGGAKTGRLAAEAVISNIKARV
jgi:monoamine oxidase